MANISDSSSVVVGRTLELFNLMETQVGRDGDQAYAQLVLNDALLKIVTTSQLAHSTKPGAAVGPRKP